jgi:hypothetical protein
LPSAVCVARATASVLGTHGVESGQTIIADGVAITFGRLQLFWATP